MAYIRSFVAYAENICFSLVCSLREYSLVVERGLAMAETGVRFSLLALWDKRRCVARFIRMV